jgi:glycosyltransferase involved in cell wall biosynthesis
LPPGADPESIRTTSVAAARQKTGLPEGRRYVGYLGNIYQRDADLLFETMSRLKAEDVHLLMVGEPGCAIPESMSDRVMVTGRVPFESMLDHLSACEVLALPLSDTIANRGRWPSKINEYVAVGRPTVACEVGDVANLLRENKIGLLVAPNAKDFALGIDELLDDTERAEAMGSMAREIAKTTYSQDAIVDKLEKYYEEVIASRATTN